MVDDDFHSEEEHGDDQKEYKFLMCLNVIKFESILLHAIDL